MIPGMLGMWPGGIGGRHRISLPTDYANLLAWYEAPPLSLIATPDDYLTRLQPSVPVDLSTWTWRGSTVTGPVSDPASGSGAYTITEDSSTGNHDIYVAPSNFTVGRAQSAYGWVKRRSGSRNFLVANDGAYVTYDLDAATASGTNATGTIVSVGGGWYKWTALLVPTATSSAVVLRMLSGTDSSYPGDGTSSLDVYLDSPSAWSQDGVISTLKDRKVLVPGLYYGGTAYDATQATFANMPYYMGELEADWSTGAPSIYNPGTSTTMNLALPAGLVAALAGAGTPFEVIALVKLYAASAASDSALLQLTGATAEARMISQKAASGKWGRYRVDDGTAHTDDTAFTDSVAVEEVALRHVFSGSADSLYKGASAPLTADASNPLAATAVTCSFTSGQLFYNAGTTSLAMGVAGLAIRTPSNDADANAIAAGMIARAA